jgi:hypothetical protein
MLNRRRLTQSLITAPAMFSDFGATPLPVPTYLSSQASLYERDPHAAALAWFKAAKWGLFMHYGLFSQLGRGEWVMLQEKIPVADYEKLADTYSPNYFDANAITDLATAAGMNYITLTTKHHEGFCLFARNRHPIAGVVLDPDVMSSRTYPQLVDRRVWDCSFTTPLVRTGIILISVTRVRGGKTIGLPMRSGLRSISGGRMPISGCTSTTCIVSCGSF